MTEESKEESQAKPHRKKLLSEAGILAAIPAVAYLMVVVYRAGYFAVFKLPIRFISFDSVEFFAMMGGLVGIGFILFSFVELLSTLFPDAHPAIALRVNFLLPFIMLAVALFWLFPEAWKVALFALAAQALAALLMLWPPPAKGTAKKSWVERLDAEDRKSVGENPWRGSLIIRFLRFLGPRWWSALEYSGVALIVVFLKGQSDATHQTEFYVASTSPETVVLYMTEDNILCSRFDRSTQQLDSSFMILDIPSNPTITYRLEAVGPLYIPTPTPTPLPTATPTLTPTFAPSPTATPSPVP